MIRIDKRTFILEEKDYELPKIISFKMYPSEIAEMDRKIVELGLHSRSEFIRAAIRFALRHIDEFKKELNELRE